LAEPLDAFGVWRLAFGVWRLAFGVWRLAKERERERERESTICNCTLEICYEKSYFGFNLVLNFIIYLTIVIFYFLTIKTLKYFKLTTFEQIFGAKIWRFT
jgi:hypothetical protein